MQDAIYLKILIWGLSCSWLEWKKILQEIISPQQFFALFSTEKKTALLVCEEKKYLPLRNLLAPLPQKSNGSPLKYLQIAVNWSTTEWNLWVNNKFNIGSVRIIQLLFLQF